MSKAFVFILASAMMFSGAAQATQIPLWQVSWKRSWQGKTETTIWKASGSRLWISTPSGVQELNISRSSLDYLRDQVSELSVSKTRELNDGTCTAYAEFKSTLGKAKICEPSLHLDSAAVTLLSRLMRVRP